MHVPIQIAACTHLIPRDGMRIGSALALLLFYPLERARIELQVSSSSAKTSSNIQSSAMTKRSLDDTIPTGNNTQTTIETELDSALSTTSNANYDLVHSIEEEIKPEDSK